MRRIELAITRKRGEYSELVVSDFESEMSSREEVRRVDSLGAPRLMDLIGRALPRMGLPTKVGGDTSRLRLVVMMGLAERQLLPPSGAASVPYIYDCWPTRMGEWESFFRRNEFAGVFFTSKTAAAYWEGRGLRNVQWMPEAINARDYVMGPPLAERPIVVLEIGRSYEAAHRAVADVIPRGLHHAPSLFPAPVTRVDLIAELRASRSLICYPGATSHPEGRTGDWETMTHRYLEAAATGALIVGQIPDEMVELFGFVPGVNAKPEELGTVLSHLRNAPEDFQPLVNRARERVVEVASWPVRVDEIISSLQAL